MAGDEFPLLCDEQDGLEAISLGFMMITSSNNAYHGPYPLEIKTAFILAIKRSEIWLTVLVVVIVILHPRIQRFTKNSRGSHVMEGKEIGTHEREPKSNTSPGGEIKSLTINKTSPERISKIRSCKSIVRG